MIERVSTWRGLRRKSSSSENSVRVSSMGWPDAAHLARPRIELEVAEAEDVPALDFALSVAAPEPPKEGAQTREQLGEREGLRQVVVGARVETGDATVDLRAGGQHQDGNTHPRGAKPAADLEPVGAGHEDVENDRVRRRLEIEALERLLAVLRELDAVPLELESTAERVADRAFVVDDQNVHRSIVRPRTRNPRES